MNKLLLSTILAGAAALPAIAGVDNLNYQAVIRNAEGVVAGKEIGLKFQFVENNQVIYTEEAFVKTSQNGLAQWLIGTNNTLENVDWSSAAIKLQVSVDLGDGNYVALSDSEISSVPTALYALKSADTEQIYVDIEDLKGELLPAVEGLEQEVNNINETIIGVNAELSRVDGFIEEQDAYNQATSDALAKLVGLDADEIDDFNTRVSAELSRLGDAQEEQATFNQNVSDELSKIQGLTYTEVNDWMERANQTIIELQNTIEQLQQEVEALKANN